MGGAESVGSLHIDVETPNLQAGGLVTGVIHMLVTAPTPASSLVLLFKGKEKTQWSVQRREKNILGQHVTNTYTYEGKGHLLKQRFPIYNFSEGRLNPGQFSFPFSIVIPPDIPSSFNYHVPSALFGPGPTIGRLRYKLVAKVEGHDSHISKGDRELYITRIMMAPIQSLADQVTARISTWCCISKGTVRLNAHFSKNAFVPGETATVHLDVDNQESKLEGTAFKVTLYRTIQLRDGKSNNHVLKEAVNSVQIATAIAAGKGLLASDQKTLQIMIPADANVALATSTRGTLIECVYSLSGEIVMDGCCMCCGDTPAVEKPMLIYPPQLERPVLPPAPQGWNPQVMPVMQFTTGSGYEYAPQPPLIQQ